MNHFRFRREISAAKSHLAGIEDSDVAGTLHALINAVEALEPEEEDDSPDSYDLRSYDLRSSPVFVDDDFHVRLWHEEQIWLANAERRANYARLLEISRQALARAKARRNNQGVKP